MFHRHQRMMRRAESATSPSRSGVFAIRIPENPGTFAGAATGISNGWEQVGYQTRDRRASNFSRRFGAKDRFADGVDVVRGDALDRLVTWNRACATPGDRLEAVGFAGHRRSRRAGLTRWIPERTIEVDVRDRVGGMTPAADWWRAMLSVCCPSKPTIIVNNLPGGGGIRAADALFNDVDPRADQVAALSVA